MLTKAQSLALYTAAISSAITALVTLSIVLGPCDPAPPSHPLPAAVESPDPVVAPAVPVEPAPAAPASAHQEPASTPMMAPAAK